MELSFNKVWERDTSGGNIALWTRGDHYALHISGTLDAASTDVVSPALDSILEQHPKELIFDLAELKYLTSMGYRLFLIALKSQNEHGGTVSFIHLQPVMAIVTVVAAVGNDGPAAPPVMVEIPLGLIPSPMDAYSCRSSCTCHCSVTLGTIIVAGRMIAYNWFDCDIQPQPAFVNWAAGCVVPPPTP